MSSSLEQERASDGVLQLARSTRGDVLERVRSALSATHASLAQISLSGEAIEVVASVPSTLVAPGTSLPIGECLLFREAAAGRAAVQHLEDSDSALEAFMRACGFRSAMVAPLGATSTNGRVAVIALAWHGPRASTELAECVIRRNEHGLRALLDARIGVAAETMVVCHHDEIVAHGIARFAEERLGVVAHACSSLDELLEQAERHQPQMVAFDERLPGDEAVADVAYRLRAAGVVCPVLLVAHTETPMSVAQALRAGVTGYVPLDAEPERVAEVMRTVLEGRSCVPQAPVECPAPVLTAREDQVLTAFDRGLTDIEIARELHISVSTVKTHARRLFRKLDVGSRTAALHRARRDGLLR